MFGQKSLAKGIAHEQNIAAGWKVPCPDSAKTQTIANAITIYMMNKQILLKIFMTVICSVVTNNISLTKPYFIALSTKAYPTTNRYRPKRFSEPLFIGIT